LPCCPDNNIIGKEVVFSLLSMICAFYNARQIHGVAGHPEDATRFLVPARGSFTLYMTALRVDNRPASGYLVAESCKWRRSAALEKSEI
jgi:hypothetical protein